MAVIIITPPAPVVTLAQAQARLRLDDLSAAEAEDITGMIAAAQGTIDGPDGWLGRAIGVQTLEARFAGFQMSTQMRLPYPPLIDVVSASYIDTGGMVQTLGSATFTASGGVLEPAFGTSWPAALGVRVRYRAGYVADPTANPLVPTVPKTIRSAILLMTQALYDGDTNGSLARAANALLEPLKVWN